jgi:hypothetical protein
MSSVPEGRAANQPFLDMTLTPPMAASLPGARVSTSIDGFAGDLRGTDLLAIELGQLLLLGGRGGGIDATRERLAQLAGERAVRFTRVATGSRRHFG